MSDLYAKFAEDFGTVKSLFSELPIPTEEKQRILNTIHERWRHWVEISQQMLEDLNEVGNWKIMKEKYRESSNLEERLTLIENFISVSHICDNMSCPVYSPLADLNLELEFMNYKSIEEARENLGEGSVAFIRFKKQYRTLITKLNEALKMTYQMITVRMTERYNKVIDRENLIQVLKSSQEARENNFLNINDAGPIEVKVKEYTDRFLGQKSEEKKPKSKKKYQDHGRRNIARMDEQYGKNLEKIRKKKTI